MTEAKTFDVEKAIRVVEEMVDRGYEYRAESYRTWERRELRFCTELIRVDPHKHLIGDGLSPMEALHRLVLECLDAEPSLTSAQKGDTFDAKLSAKLSAGE